MRATTWLESIFNANRIRPSRAKRRGWRKKVLAGYHTLEDRRLLAGDTLVSLIGGTLTITDISGGNSNDQLTISYASGSYTISDSSLIIDSSITGSSGQGTRALTVPASGVAGITFDTRDGDDTVNVFSLPSGAGDFTVLGSIGNDTVNLRGDIFFGSNEDLNLDLADGAMVGDFDQISIGDEANLSLNRWGSATLTASGRISLESGSSITTVDGDLTLSANQQAAPTAGSFYGIHVNGGLIESTGVGEVLVEGRGGNAGDNQIGVHVSGGGRIIGGTGGVLTVAGDGGASAGQFNVGVFVWGRDSTITTNGADIAIDGRGGGSGGVGSGVRVTQLAKIFATGSSSINISGTSADTPYDYHASWARGVSIWAQIQTTDGDLTITGTAMGSTPRAAGIYLGDEGVSVTGNGRLVLDGSGSVSGTGTENHGLWLKNGTISTNSGKVEIRASAGQGSTALMMDAVSLTTNDASINVVADSLQANSSSEITAGNGQSVTIRQKTAGTSIDLGGDGALGSTLGISDTELGQMTAGLLRIGDSDSGAIDVSAAITSSNNLSLTTGAGLTFNDAVTMVSGKDFIATTTNHLAGIVLATTSANISATGSGKIRLSTPRNIRLSSNSSITTADGDLTLSANQQMTLTSGNFIGVDIDGGLIESTGTGVVTVEGRGGNDASGSQLGVYVRNGADIIGGTIGLTTVSGVGGASAGDSNWGVAVFDSGSTISSNGSDILVSGLGGGSGNSGSNNGVLVFSSAQIFAFGGAAVSVNGTSFATNATSSSISPGVYVGLNARVGTEDGSLLVTGTGMGDSIGRGIMILGSGLVSATGTGNVSLVGSGSDTGIGNTNYGVWLSSGGTVSSNTGAVDITATAGAGSIAFKMDSGTNLNTTSAGINVFADSMDFDGASNTAGLYVWLRSQTPGTLIDLGGVDALGSTLGLTDVELDSITVSDGVYIGDASSGDLLVSAPITHGNDLNLLVTTAGITLNESITLAADKHLYGQSGELGGIVLSTVNADISTSGTGSVYLTTPRNISLAPGSSITTVDGNLTALANQQATPAAGDFVGVDIDGGSIQSTGTGVVRVEGRGGDDSSGAQRGVHVRNGGDIIGGTSGMISVWGIGRVSSSYDDFGVFVSGSGSTITSNGADVSVVGFGSEGVFVLFGGEIFATGSAAVTVLGTSSATNSQSTRAGVDVFTGRIGTANGSLTVTGIAMGNGSGRGVNLFNGTVSATGTGSVTLDGTGTATGNTTLNDGLRISANSIVSSNTGAIEITATAGAGSSAFKMDSGIPELGSINAPIAVIADSMAIDTSAIISIGSTQQVTLRQKTNGIAIDLGGADVLGSTLGLSDDELDRITADTINIGDTNSGDILISAPVNLSPNAALNLNTAANVISLASGTDISIGLATVAFEPGSNLNVTINGTTADVDYDQLNVAGQVDLTGFNLAVSGSHAPSIGEQFVVVENDGSDAIVGAFNGLPEGSVISNFLGSSLSASISYLGIDASSGNDVVLTVLTPNLSPTVVGDPVINGGSINRSGLGSIAFSFSEPVNFLTGSLRLYNHTTGALIDTSSIAPTGIGTTELTWTLWSLTFPDGRYTAELVNTQVEDLSGLPLAFSFAFELHVRRGDLDGDAKVAFSDYNQVGANFDPIARTPYRDGDADGDGKVAFSDYNTVGAGFDPVALSQLDHDWGDAPESGTSFPTTGIVGARHILGSELYLGAGVDSEVTGDPAADADNDSFDDGIAFSNLVIGTRTTMDVTANIPTGFTGYLNAWIDFNQDGDWDDAGEQIVDDQSLADGIQELQFDVPEDASAGTSFARFRLTETPGYSYFGLSPHGEVEDYAVTVTASDQTERRRPGLSLPIAHFALDSFFAGSDDLIGRNRNVLNDRDSSESDSKLAFVEGNQLSQQMQFANGEAAEKFMSEFEDGTLDEEFELVVDFRKSLTELGK